MFQSSGFFKKIQCPFFKHDLCHRPFCHYNHPKPEKEKEKEKEEEIVARFSTESSDDEALNRTPPDGVNEDVLKIVQNITPTKLREYEKRQQESHELQEKLKLVDDVDTTLSELIPETVAAIRSREDIRRGLIDSFYSKDKVQVNITSGDINNKPSTTNPQVNLDKFSKGGRIVCNCDDPDCSGFQEENADCSFSHVDIDQIEDEYTRRKMQRRLDRRKKDDSPIRTDVVIRESDFFIAPAEDPDDPPQPPEPIDDDLNDYIDRVKEEYEQKKRLEAAQLEAEKKLEAERKLEAEKKLETEKKLEAEKRNGIVEKEAVIEKEKALVEKEKSSKSEKKVIMNGKEKVDTVKTDKEKETKDRSKSREKKFETADKEKVDKDKSEKVKEGKDKEEKKKGDKDSSSSEKKQKVVDKKVLTDVDFFSPKVSESNTNSDADDVTDVNGVSDDDDDSDDEVIDTTTEKKSKIIDDIANLSKDLKKKSIKVINDKVKKKRIFIPNDDGDDGDGEKTEKKSNKNEKEADGKSTKKKKSKYEEEVDGEDKSKKKKKHDSNKDEESSRMKSKDKPSNGSSKKYDEDQIISKKDKVKKSSSDKIKNSDSRKNSESFDGAKKSRKNSDSSNSLIKDKKTGGIDLTKLKHKDSDASNSSRGAFDVICLSSSEDDDDEEITERAYSSCEELYDPDEMEHASRKLEEHFASIEKEKPDVKSVKPGEGKKRVALTNQEIQRKPVLPHKSKFMKMSYVSPSLKSAKPTEDTVLTPKSINKPIPKPSTPETSSTDDYSFGTGKKRVSHVQPKPSSDKSVDAERPKLQVDIGGKVPHIVRTKFFDKIIDEIIPKVKTKKEAFEKGIQEEADAYKRSSRKQIYINVCANIVKRIRAMPDYTGPREPLPSTKTADPMRTGQPTTKSAVKSKILNSLKSDLAKPSKTVDLIGSITKNSTNINRIQSASTAGYKKVSPKSTIPKNCIKPASSVLVKKVADQPPTPTSGKRVRTSSLSSEPMELTEDNFYEHMKQYLLSTEQLWENKYPKRDPDNPKGTIIKDYVGNTNTLKRVCCRCGKEYFMNKKGKYVTRNECHYHWGKLLRTRGRNSNAHAYSCCGADAAGDTCALCRLHVCNKVGPLANYVTTEFCVNKDSKRKVFALDCEMCYTTQGLELTRLTVIDFDLEQIIDLFVKPANPIVDYNTRFSGVTREDLADVTTTIEDIHDILLNMIDKETILLGHSLESDLNALNIIHDNVVDTALVFPHRLGLPFKRALRNLMVDYLQKVIQSGEGGHDSCEDARSCMELMKHKFREDQKSRKRAKT